MKLARLAFDGLCYMGLACVGLMLFSIGLVTLPCWAWQSHRERRGA